VFDCRSNRPLHKHEGERLKRSPFVLPVSTAYFFFAAFFAGFFAAFFAAFLVAMVFYSPFSIVISNLQRSVAVNECIEA
jgi:hypothetical protein